MIDFVQIYKGNLIDYVEMEFIFFNLQNNVYLSTWLIFFSYKITIGHTDDHTCA